MKKWSFAVLGSGLFFLGSGGVSLAEQNRLEITTQIPVVCRVSQEMGDTTARKAIVHVNRFCNTGHRVQMSITMEDEPVEGVLVLLEGKKISANQDGEWEIYEASPPAKTSEEMTIELPASFRSEGGGLIMSIQIETES